MPDFPDRPGYSFDPGPPPEASRFLKNKGLRPSFAWEDVEPEEHAVAFTVAKAMQLDVLEDIRAEVQRALDEGRTLAQFKKDLKPKLVAAGWWGRREMTDPDTGEVREVQLGSPRRLRTIYDANLRSARAAGQWERIQRTKKLRPYLVYELGPSERHRADHASKRGLVLPADDPFWDTWFPPNGWGCKCRVRQIGKSEAERLGIREAPRVEERPWRNPRTGEVRMVPRGIDPAWTGNPGADRMRRTEEMLAGRLAAADPAVARVILKDIATSWRVDRIMDGAEGRAPVAILPPVAQQLPEAAEARLLYVNADTKLHLVDEKPDADRVSHLRHLDALAIATEGYVRRTTEGLATLHLYVPDIYPATKRNRTASGLHVVIWFDDGARIRTLIPGVSWKQWLRNRDDPASTVLGLE